MMLMMGISGGLTGIIKSAAPCIRPEVRGWLNNASCQTGAGEAALIRKEKSTADHLGLFFLGFSLCQRHPSSSSSTIPIHSLVLFMCVQQP